MFDTINEMSLLYRIVVLIEFLAKNKLCNARRPCTNNGSFCLPFKPH